MLHNEHLDGVAGLRPVGRLYFFQSALVAVPGAFLAVWWFAIPLLGGRYSVWRGVYAGLLVFVVACEFFAFLAPMWSFHRIMSKGKEEFLDEADHISDQAAQIQKELLDSGSESDIAQLEDKLGRLTKRYQAIVQMPTWPVDTTIRRRFAVNNLLLFVPVVAQVLGAPGSVQNLLDNVQKVFTGQAERRSRTSGTVQTFGSADNQVQFTQTSSAIIAASNLDGICQTVHEYTHGQRPLFGYLLTCSRTGAWRGSVQVPGSSLSIRLPVLVAWLSFGLRGPGAVGRERLKRGLLSSK